MNALHRMAAAIAFTAALSGGAASALGVDAPYSGFLVFGDSLSDTGRVAAATGGASPPPLPDGGPQYFAGRFSNGPVWADLIGAEFAAASKPVVSFAFGGAAAVAPDPLGAPPFPDLPIQLQEFALSGAAGVLGANPLAAILIGGNDIVRAAQGGGDAAAAGAAAAASALQAVGFLASTFGIGDFLLFQLSDVGGAPAVAAFGPAAAQAGRNGALAFNAALTTGAAPLRDGGLRISLADLFAPTEALAANPAIAGLTDVTTPCVIATFSVPSTVTSVCTLEEAAQRAYFDPLHPNAAVQALFADAARSALGESAAVPLPPAAALLALGLCGLAAARRRRAA